MPAAFAAALHGAVAGSAAFNLIPARRAQASLIATVGASIALAEYLRVATRSHPVWIPPVWSGAIPLARAGDVPVAVTPIALATSAVAFAAAAALLLAMRRSGFGRAWRAYSDDAGAAALFGIDGRRLVARSAAISGALAGLAGGLVAVQFGSFGFADGFQLGLKALAAAVLGGIGSVPGSLIGGLGIGLFETLWSAALPIETRDAALYVALVALVVIRPNGIFGQAATAGPNR